MCALAAVTAVLLGVSTPLQHTMDAAHPETHPLAGATPATNMSSPPLKWLASGSAAPATPPPPKAPREEIESSTQRRLLREKVRSPLSAAASISLMRPLELVVATGVVIAALGSVWVFWTLASIKPAPAIEVHGSLNL
jgi:hypothetical protein|uniref:Uncharacterized protein n=1 Tax=Haptolina ericina TaxID=156174 RepID=A0A7S3F2B8_9EUKA|mmetsp:Transcript_47878/g.107893  ORF Transcript_47878/g.107893 Transcript_47878/m.107893 type:complete len:138 (+) Transcript_47878:90-503(+)|eukprot:CAMPEP_0181208432 /NCGR_PEP_ID=MMETSP1096-20121128/22114_1 /TAXON_ID=156174 ORGANISM="Chrysochromulina ericina, Strain CCMP281" /NCGR_SAMPLE_ID=MMETSP1096 /ASSEMBLY_ACC=CAM_ASM_000453 /LENGTH=137 /DNA_ID=CAMNT_0023299495 /DNA_START=70 /DNA_END=483 /DNA_ORIENTATION=+